MGFLDSEAGKRAQSDGRAVFDWLKSALHELPRREAIKSLINKVMEEELSLEALQMARGLSVRESEVRAVLTDAMEGLSTMRPPHWVDPFRQERSRNARAAAHEAQMLLDWLLLITPKFPREEALEMFLQRVMNEQISKPVVNWVCSHAVGHEDAYHVISEGIATLDRTRPAHWDWEQEGLPAD